MPRKAKDEKIELNVEKNKLKEEAANKKITKKTSSLDVKNTSKKNSTAKTKTTNKAVKKTSTKKETAKRASSKASSSSSKKTTKKKTVPVINEYYDLPFRYNQSVVKILAQTPNTLFVYWDISDEDRLSYTEKYGENFFNETRPYLFITNETKGYSFEVEINDFANSWYLHIDDADCKYKIELRRKFVFNSENSRSTSDSPFNSNDYISITSSNEIDAPNDHILFDKIGNSVFFRNIKTNIVEEKNIFSLSFLKNMGKVYNIYDVYKEIYQDELDSDKFELNIPSSSKGVNND